MAKKNTQALTTYKGYEMVIGIEVHVELGTETKIFCGCSTDTSAPPNTNVCPGCMGLPGSLPVLNEKVVEYAVRAGMAINCEIARFSKMDRKNYFYPDLPAAYQISQFDLPICKNGSVAIDGSFGSKVIGVTRIHIEEDAGKLIHGEKGASLIDHNRCGMPLIEIVSEPDIRSAEEAVAYLRKLRATLIYVGASQCRMNEGAFRCDVNLSVRKVGAEKFGTRVEMKNLNSFQHVSDAIAVEFVRQIDLIESGGEVIQQTRRYDEAKKETFSMRTKENAEDYRYFPDPNLLPIILSEDYLDAIRQTIPVLPDERKRLYMADFGLSAIDSEQLTAEKFIADYFDETVRSCKHPRVAARLLLSETSRLAADEVSLRAVSPAVFADIADMLGSELINSGTAKHVLAEMVKQPGDPREYVRANKLEQISDPAALAELAQGVIAGNQSAAKSYLSGREAAFSALMGELMKASNGLCRPDAAKTALLGALEDAR